MVAVVKSFARIEGRFACVYGGIRTADFSHEWSKEAGGAIQANPGDAAEWLKLADRLEEEGNPAALVIKAAFLDGFIPPADFRGELYRGGRYMENGQHYDEGVTVKWEPERPDYGGKDSDAKLPPGFVFHFWQGGNCHRTITPNEIRDLLSNPGRRTTWCSVRATGEVAPLSRIVPAGSIVAVLKKVGSEVKRVNPHYQTQRDIEVPATAHGYSVSDDDWRNTYTMTEFEHKGFIVRVRADEVAVC